MPLAHAMGAFKHKLTVSATNVISLNLYFQIRVIYREFGGYVDEQKK